MALLNQSDVDDLFITQTMSIGGSFVRPNLPIACVSKNDGSSCYGTLGPVPFNIIHHLNGIMASNGNSRFTMPEPGQYFCLFWTIGHNNCGATGRLNIRVNGGNVSYQARSDFGIRYGNCYASGIYNLSAGDYIEASMTDGFLYFNADVYNKFVIYKVI